MIQLDIIAGSPMEREGEDCGTPRTEAGQGGLPFSDGTRTSASDLRRGDHDVTLLDARDRGRRCHCGMQDNADCSRRQRTEGDPCGYRR